MTFDLDLFWSALTSAAFVRGTALTCGLAILAMIAASLLGFSIALTRGSARRSFRWFGASYVWFWRAVPTLLVLLLVWNAGPQLIPALRSDWFTPFLAAFISISLVESAYMAEIVRSALLSVDEGQYQASRALGFTPWQIMRKVVVPQAIRIALPPSGNEFIAMIKYTSLASVISLRELLTTAQVQVSATFRYAEYYAAALVYYLAIVSIVMGLQSAVERRYLWLSKSPVDAAVKVPNEMSHG